MRRDEPVRIDVWSDYVCPFCYLELPVLDAVQARLGAGLDVVWRAFELRPEPEPTLDPDGAYLHRVWNASVYPMARERGMRLRLPPVQPRSRRAFEAAAHARDHGLFDPMNRALFKAFFEDGRDLADVAILGEVGCSVGLDGEELARALASGRHAEEVAVDLGLARRLGIGGVPALLVSGAGEAVLLSGAQPEEALLAAIERAARPKGEATSRRA